MNNAAETGRLQRLRQTLIGLYEGDSRRAHRFRYALLVFDSFTILFIIGTSFAPRVTPEEWIDAVLGVEQGSQALPHDLVIVDEDDAQCLHRFLLLAVGHRRHHTHAAALRPEDSRPAGTDKSPM